MHLRALRLTRWRILTLPLLVLLAFSAHADEGDFPDNHLVEPPLSSYAKGPLSAFTAFRFSLSRSVEDEDLSYTLILKNGDQPPSVTLTSFSKTANKIVSQHQMPLTPGQLKNLLKGERMSNFWELPRKSGRTGFDGAIWKMEGISGKRTNTIERWSPLPPYYSFVLDSKTDTLVKDPKTPPGSDFKSSDEVGLDMFSLMIIYLKPGFDGAL
ncbi:MAG: hypothetical protein AAAB16_19380 [Pseudomonas sp.]|uniref:hypothetical protein n=1 Tax=Pseudomonas sp. TaxID=306 RepID=UPI0030F043DB